MRIYILIIFINLTPIYILAGNEPTKQGSYQRVSSQELEPLIINSETASQVQKIIKSRSVIWKNSNITKQKRHEKILSLYEESMSYLESSEDYILLLKDTQNLAPTSDQFIISHLEDFFNTVPSLPQIIELTSLSTSPKTVTAIKERSLKIIEAPADFLALVQITCSSPNKEYKQAATDFIKLNMTVFKNTNPKIEEIITLQYYIFKLQVDIEKTIAALIKLKETFIDQVAPHDLIKLLDYGCASPATEYKNQLDNLISSNLNNLFAKESSLRLVIKLESLTSKINTRLVLKNFALNLIKSPADFLEVVKAHTREKLSKAYKQELTDFIRINILVFRNTKPTIEEIITLQDYIFTLQEESLEKTVSTLIKLKETFLDDFSGADLIRLFSYGCENPSDLYKEQIIALKKIYNIDF